MFQIVAYNRLFNSDDIQSHFICLYQANKQTFECLSSKEGKRESYVL